LREATLQSCLFVDTDLRYSDLTKTDLSGSEIRKSKFFGAKLNQTNLRHTKLKDLDFTRAFTTNLNLDNAQISNVIGMETNAEEKKLKR